MKKISVSIPGCNGRMGKTLLSLILENPKYEIAAATCLPNEEEVGIDIGFFAGKSKINKEINAEPLTLFQNSNVLVDFTAPDATMFHAKECYNNNMSIVIGTTGFSADQENELRSFSKKIPIIYSANFSIGVTLLSKLVSNATKILGFDWDIEV
ncbi:MAG: 4-hydroxy-tetrahydrodipicolinate reductase, partial [Rhodospirillaceae bacterium]|nr:4-hydroxy-tetrahydrodipicolinate reductase [Rhodospirillaceae bacterium]